jgi:hypothetical protein
VTTSWAAGLYLAVNIVDFCCFHWKRLLDLLAGYCEQQATTDKIIRDFRVLCYAGQQVNHLYSKAQPNFKQHHLTTGFSYYRTAFDNCFFGAVVNDYSYSVRL